MGSFLQVHKVILLATGIGIVLAVCLQVYVSSPAGQAYDNLSGEVDDLRKQLKKLKAPADDSQLESLRGRLKQQQTQTNRLEKQILQLYQSVYEPAIQRNNWSLESFVRQSPKPTRDFYMKEFDRIIGESPYGDLAQHPSWLGLSRDSDAPERYELLLKLWCVESMLSQAKANGLVLAREKPEEGGEARTDRQGRGRFRSATRRPQAIGAQPALRILPSTLILSAHGKKRSSPEYLQLRFRVGLVGKFADIEALVCSLSTPGTFFGIGAFELMKLPPPKGKVRGEGMRLNIECVSYVPLSGT